MSDLVLTEFYARIARIQKARAKGYGFEAPGTLGRSSYTIYNRRKARKVSVLRPVVIVLICGTVLKAVFLQHLGTQAYDDGVARLMQGAGFDQIGGWLMQADPMTQAMAEQLGRLLASQG